MSVGKYTACRKIHTKRNRDYETDSLFQRYIHIYFFCLFICFVLFWNILILGLHLVHFYVHL